MGWNIPADRFIRVYRKGAFLRPASLQISVITYQTDTMKLNFDNFLFSTLFVKTCAYTFLII